MVQIVPFVQDLERWRNNFQSIRYQSTEHNYDFGGAVDDIWQKKNGDLIIVDVKATSRNNFDWSETLTNTNMRKLTSDNQKCTNGYLKKMISKLL